MPFELSPEEKAATMDSINSFKKQDPDLENLYEVEFYISGAGKKDASRLEGYLVENEVIFDDIDLEDDEILLSIDMQLDYNIIIRLEILLGGFCAEHGLQYEGWGAYE